MPGTLAELYAGILRQRNEPQGVLSQPATSNPLMMAKALRQEQSYPRTPLSEAINAPMTWQQFFDNVQAHFPIDSPAAVRQAAFEAAKNAGPLATVYHGTRNVKTWMDNPEYRAMFEDGKDIPRGIAESTYPIGQLKGGLGGMKMMDGLGPHVGTAQAANERIAKNAGLSPSKAFNKPDERISNAYVMPFDFNPTKPFSKKDGTPFTETELQSKLSDIAESLGFSRADTRHYSSAYATPAKMKMAQKAVRDKLLADGYDAIPYINSHEARGSVSYVVLDPQKLEPLFK